MLTSSMMALLIPQANDLSTAYIAAFQQDLQTLDAHNHTVGNGAQIPSAAININAALPFNDFSATQLRSAQLQNLTAALNSASDDCSIFVYNGDLYYLNASNVAVRLTNGSGLNPTMAALTVQSLTSLGSIQLSPLPGYSGGITFAIDTSNNINITTGTTGEIVLGSPMRLAQAAATIESQTQYQTNGTLYYDTTNNRIRAYVNSVWKTVQVA